MAHNVFDLMIVGTGPAGLTAALYGRRMGLEVVVFGDTPGGNLVKIKLCPTFQDLLVGYLVPNLVP